MIFAINRLFSNILPVISRERRLLLKTFAICKGKRRLDGQGVCGGVGGQLNLTAKHSKRIRALQDVNAMEADSFWVNHSK